CLYQKIHKAGCSAGAVAPVWHRGQTIVRHGNSCIPRGCSFFRYCAKKYPDCAEEKIDFRLKILTFAVALVGVPRGF
ncbi:MAG: hypothetical protein HXL37_04610, partial [Riemerella sp.]|nr:hypothetical protein [Riemerella sp.]